MNRLPNRFDVMTIKIKLQPGNTDCPGGLPLMIHDGGGNTKDALHILFVVDREAGPAHQGDFGK